MLSGLTQKFKNNTFNNRTILASTLAAGVLLDMFAGEAGEGEELEEETTAGYFYRYLYCSGMKFVRFLALEFISQNTNTRMYTRNIHMYIYITEKTFTSK